MAGTRRIAVRAWRGSFHCQGTVTDCLCLRRLEWAAQKLRSKHSRCQSLLLVWAASVEGGRERTGKDGKGEAKGRGRGVVGKEGKGRGWMTEGEGEGEGEEGGEVRRGRGRRGLQFSVCGVGNLMQYSFPGQPCLTLQNCTPRTLFPVESSGGDQTIIPHTLGTTIKMAPDTPDLAGKPTWKNTKDTRHHHQKQKQQR